MQRSTKMAWALGLAALLPVAASLAAPLQHTSDTWPSAENSPAAYPEANHPYPVFAATPAITMPPLLMGMGTTTVEIEWMTDAPSDARVRYGIDKLDHVAVPQTDGLVPVGTLHRVVLRDLKPGQTYRYQVESRRVIDVRAYWPEMGKAVTSKEHAFTTFDKASSKVSFAFITDTHEDVARIDALMKMIAAKPVDFVVDGGDIVNYATGGNQLRHKFLGPVAKALHGDKPLVYVRGNHENRGPFARSMGPYLHAPNGRYYYTRDAGPVHMLIVDTGEDKPDATHVYAGLNDMRDYKRQERAWFAKALQKPRVKSAPFTVVLAHQPGWGWSDGHNRAWTQLANQAHVDLVIAGHVHTFEFIKPGEKGNHFPVLVVGQDQVAHVVATASQLSVTVTARNGKLVYAFTLPRRHK